MTEEQKRFKIQKIESYEEQISQEKEDAILGTILVGTAAVLAITGISSGIATESIDSVVPLVSGVLSTGLGMYALKNTIESICKKTNLEGKVEQINEELGLVEKEETRGKTR